MEEPDLLKRPTAVLTPDGLVHRAATLLIPGVRDDLMGEWRTMIACNGVISDDYELRYDAEAFTCVTCASGRQLVGDQYRYTLKELSMGAMYGRTKLPSAPAPAHAWRAQSPNYTALEQQILAAYSETFGVKKSFRRRLMETLLGR